MKHRLNIVILVALSLSVVLSIVFSFVHGSLMYGSDDNKKATNALLGYMIPSFLVPLSILIMMSMSRKRSRWESEFVFLLIGFTALLLYSVIVRDIFCFFVVSVFTTIAMSLIGISKIISENNKERLEGGLLCVFPLPMLVMSLLSVNYH